MSDAAETASGSTPVERLVALFALEPLDRDLFLGSPGRGKHRLFGGLVAAQSFVAAARTLESDEARPLHSLHAYFLRPGSYEQPLRFVVHRIRDGRSFTTRRVVAHQGGEAIFSLSASFASAEEGIAYQDDAPPSPAPESCPEHFGGPWRDPALRASNPIEMRSPDGLLEEGEKPPAKRIMWMRPRGAVPDDPTLHTALLVYASDRNLVSTVVRGRDEPRESFRLASLDHALWLHRPFRFEGWTQFVSESPVAHGARGLIFGSVYAEGERVASIAQEGLVRRSRES